TTSWLAFGSSSKCSRRKPTSRLPNAHFTQKTFILELCPLLRDLAYLLRFGKKVDNFGRNEWPTCPGIRTRSLPGRLRPRCRPTTNGTWMKRLKCAPFEFV